MTARLTDEQLESLEHSHGMIESEYTPTCRSVPYGSGCPGATDDSLDFWRRSADAVPAMLAEIRERRAADLSPEMIALNDTLIAEVERLRDLLKEAHKELSTIEAITVSPSDTDGLIDLCRRMEAAIHGAEQKP